MNHSVQSHHTTQAGGASNGDHTPKASSSDHAMYLGFMALMQGLGEIEDAGATLADLSKTLYDEMIKNGMNHLQDMQKELSALSYLQHNFSAFKAYAEWKQEIDIDRKGANNPWLPSIIRKAFQSALNQLSGHAPNVGTTDQSLIDACVNELGKFSSLTSLKGYVNSLSQQISSENIDIQNNKQIPDAMQSQVRTLTNAQGEIGSMIATFLRLTQDQLQYSK